MNPRPCYKPGDKIGGRYQVHQALMGGMGEVYLCLDLETIQPFALKTFQQRYQTGTQRLRQAFEREVATWVALEKHPNIVRCFYMDTLDNQPFMILEWIAGEEGKGADLRGWLRHGPLDLQLALDLSIDVCRGLIHAQEKQPGLVHRDLKPENTLVAQGRWAKITDFGLAEIIRQADLELDAAGVEMNGRQSIVGHKGIAGTPTYMAPEQWKGESLDARADIYALGCILYEMLTGEPPFQVGFRPTTHSEMARWLQEMQAQHENNPIAALPTSLPAAVGDLVQHCLAKAYVERPSLKDLLRQLENLYQGQFATTPRAALPVGQFTAVDHNDRGVTYANLKRYEEALHDYSRAIELNPNSAHVYSNRGFVYESLQRFDEALADYNRAIHLNRDLAEAYVNRSALFFAAGRLSEGLSDIDQAIHLNPVLPRAYMNRASAYITSNRFKEAFVDFNRAIELNPNDAQIYYNRAKLYETVQQFDKALSDYDRAIQIDPNYSWAYNSRGHIHAILGHLNESLDDFTHAIETDPSHVLAYTNRGTLYIQLDQYSKAISDFTSAIQIEPTNIVAYTNRGAAYYQMGQFDNALADFRKGIELDPNNALAYRNIGMLAYEQGMLQEALQHFEQAAKRGDTDGAEYATRVRKEMGIIPASQDNLAQIIHRLKTDEKFRERFRSDPVRCVAESQLTIGQVLELVASRDMPLDPMESLKITQKLLEFIASYGDR